MNHPGFDPARLLSTWAADAAAFAEVLIDLDPSWGSETFPLAGGIGVLCGPGMYINRVLGAGLERGLANDEWDRLEQRSGAVGVDASIEITVHSHADVRARASARGYVLEEVNSALVHDARAAMPTARDSGFEIVPANGGLLPAWQEASAQGFGALDPARRRVSDAFARAAAVVDGDRFVIVLDPDDQRPLATASMSVRDGVATLGGMSTVPAERGRGVQSALIRHRIRVARELGCDLVASTAAPGSQSERNLIRHGFRRVFDIEEWTRLT